MTALSVLERQVELKSPCKWAASARVLCAEIASRHPTLDGMALLGQLRADRPAVFAGRKATWETAAGREAHQRATLRQLAAGWVLCSLWGCGSIAALKTDDGAHLCETCAEARDLKGRKIVGPKGKTR